MFQYYVRLALLSLKRNLVLTLMMIAAIGVGIGASLTTLTVFRAMSGDPIPEKSGRLFAVQIDTWGPDKPTPPTSDGLEDQLTYTDAAALMRSHEAVRQSVMYVPLITLRSDDAKQKPLQVPARAAYSDFFAMFDVPFRYGRPWSAQDDANRAAVVVLGREMNDRLFGGANSIGKTIRLDNESYTVVGVTADWQPVPHFYDLHITPFGQSDLLFIPFGHAIDRHLRGIGSVTCKSESPNGWESFLASDCLWLQYWVELPDPAAVTAYRAYLGAYATEQRRIGRFQWPSRTQLRNVTQWLDYKHVVPSEINILLVVSFGFLFVCVLNAMGLMLAKIMGRASDIGVRRALGATRSSIFAQCLIESGIVGLAGGLVGLAFTAIGLSAARSMLPKNFTAVTYLDWFDIALAVFLAIGATVAAGIYPTWRAAQVQPAWQLKAQ